MYIYIYIYIYIYVYYTSTYIKELCQQFFKYNEGASCTSHTKLAILLLQDLSTLCATDIYGIYFRLSVQCS